MATLEDTAQLETLKILYRECCYNVQRCDKGSEEYSRGCAIAQLASTALNTQGGLCNEQLEVMRFIAATYAPR